MYKTTAAYRCQTESFTSKLRLNKKKTSDLKFMNCMYKTFNVIWVSTCLASFIFSSFPPFMMPFHFLLVHTETERLILRKLQHRRYTNTHTHTHAHTHTHSHSCTNTTRVSNCNLLVPLGVPRNLEGFCNIKQRYLTESFKHSVSPL